MQQCTMLRYVAFRPDDVHGRIMSAVEPDTHHCRCHYLDRCAVVGLSVGGLVQRLVGSDWLLPTITLHLSSN